MQHLRATYERNYNSNNYNSSRTLSRSRLEDPSMIERPRNMSF